MAYRSGDSVFETVDNETDRSEGNWRLKYQAKEHHR